MVLKLYGFPLSPFTRLVAVVCKEKEIPFELVAVNVLKGEQNNPEFLKFQPFGQIPYIDDEGFILFEARAIARYLIKKYPSQGTFGLIPTDPKAEALFEQAASIEASDFNPVVAPLVFEKVYKSALGFEPDLVKANEYLKKLEANLDVYEIILGKQKYLGGDSVTLADLQHLPHGSLIPVAGHGDLYEKRPNVARWWKDISSRPSWEVVKDWTEVDGLATSTE